MYGKLFASMFRGSLYGKWQAIVTFQQMIILADQDGTVDFTPEALSATTSIPLDIIQEGIALLEAPDPSSRSPGEEGRRIVLLNPDRPWGWQIVNYQHYRSIRTAEERRAYHREYWRKNRKTQPDSTETQQSQPIVEAEVEVEAINTLSGKPDAVCLQDEKNGKNYRAEALEVLQFLNETTGRKYRAVEATLKPIICRLKSGVTVQDCRTMIVRKWRDWHQDEKMEKYLRPATLFRASNFENYLAECVAK